MHPFLNTEEAASPDQQVDEQRLLEIATPGHPLRLIFDLAPNGIMLVAPDGLAAMVNKRAAMMFGYDSEEIVGQSIEILLPEKYRHKHPEDRRAFLKQPSTRYMGAGRDLYGRRKDGVEFPVEIGLTPIPTANGTYVLSSIVDITERKGIEQQIVEAARMKSEFLANMSHEIRTPMNVIIGMSQVLIETELNKEQRRYAQMIASGAESLLTIVNDVLDFSKIEAGKLQISSVNFDLNSVAQEAAAFLAESAARKSLKLICNIDPSAPTVCGDPGRIRQILVNIIGNAIKFTETGEVEVSVSYQSKGDRAMAKFVVRDTGIGMSYAVRASLFRPFSQGDASFTRKYGGTGLGLAICKRLVELMGGAIRVTSSPGEGSTFSFTVPVALAAAPPPRPMEKRLKGKRVLVVDQDKDTRAELVRTLSQWKIVCSEASGAVEALGLLREARTAGTGFNAAIFDLDLAGISGLDLARFVRSDPAIRSLPIATVVWPVPYPLR